LHYSIRKQDKNGTGFFKSLQITSNEFSWINSTLDFAGILRSSATYTMDAVLPAPATSNHTSTVIVDVVMLVSLMPIIASLLLDVSTVPAEFVTCDL